MPVMLKDVKGLMIPIDESPFSNSAVNQIIDEQGERKIGMNRERLAAILYNAKGGSYDVLNEQDKLYCLTDSYQEADAIISHEAQIIEVQND